MSAFVALREKKLNFDFRTINLNSQENRDTNFSSVSLTSRVPTLSDGDFSLSESSAIAEYVEEVYPPIDFILTIFGSVEEHDKFKLGLEVI